MVVHLKAPFPMNTEHDLSAIPGKEHQILHFMVLVSSSCTSQGKSRSGDVRYFRSRQFAFPSEDFWLRFSFPLYPGSFVESNCCVAWMSSLLVTVSSYFHVKPKRNKLMVAHQAAIFVCLAG